MEKSGKENVSGSSGTPYSGEGKSGSADYQSTARDAMGKQMDECCKTAFKAQAKKPKAV